MSRPSSLLPPDLIPAASAPVPFGVSPRTEENAELRRYWHLLMQGKWVLLVALALGVGLALVYVNRAVPVYQAAATILINDKQNNLVVLDPMAGARAPNDLETEMEVLRSRALAEEVVDSLSLRLQLVKPQRVERSAIFARLAVGPEAQAGSFELVRTGGDTFTLNDASGRALLTGVRVGVPVTLPGGGTFTLATPAAQQRRIEFTVQPNRVAAALLMRSMTVAQPSRDADVILLKYEGTDPGLITSVPNVLADVYIRQRRANKKYEATSTVAFLVQQVDTLARQLHAAENALGAYRTNAQVIDPTAQGSAELTRFIALQGERASLEADRNALFQLLEELKKQKPGSESTLSYYRRALATPALASNATATGIMTAIYQAEGQRADLLVRRTPEDPDVKALDERIAGLEADLGTIVRTFAEGLNTQLASRDAEIAKFSGQMARIPQTAIVFDQLSRQTRLLEQVYSQALTHLKDAQVAGAVEDASARVLDKAILPIAPVSPKKPLVLGVSAMISLLLGIIILALREGLDYSIHTREEVQQFTGVPNLGLIPVMRAPAGAMASMSQASGGALKRLFTRGEGTPVIAAPTLSREEAAIRASVSRLDQRLIVGKDPRNPISEAYRTLRTNITFAQPGATPKSLVFTSPMPGDGKSTTASNLAISLSQQGLRVLLIDADMRRGLLNMLFNVPREPGLSNVLMGYAKLQESLSHVELNDGSRLTFLATGTLPPNPAELLGSQRMRDFMTEVEGQFDAVLLDAPPLNLVTDAAILGTFTDGVILVARSGITTRQGLGFAMDMLRNVRANVLGTVLNGVDVRRDSRYYGYGQGVEYYYGAPDVA